MTLTTNTLLLAGVLVVATCAVVIVVLALWDVARDWCAGERRMVPVREHDDLRPKR